ncbi:MAG: WecB/TagA/CpsF family glycosyltransferase [Gemmatimonadaceae bacterium]|nr:WecB/TagA/CpsF family glycosyltransferase [Gemmatimonadaceae bacterium]
MRHRVRFGRLWVDALGFDEALLAVRDLVNRRQGGAIFTPNVDHVVMADQHAGLRRAYRRASLSFADGMPLVWTSRLLGRKIPEKLSGSDMLVPIIQLAAAQDWGVYFLGGMPGVPGAAELAAERLHTEFGVRIVGVDPAFVSMNGDGPDDAAVVERVRAARPDLVFVALGAPKQELWIARSLDQIRPAVAIGCGASLDFISGHVSRAPAWVSNAGFEWAYRLAQDPRRLWKRYLIRGPRFIGILFRTARLLKAQRVRTVARRGVELPAIVEAERVRP